MEKFKLVVLQTVVPDYRINFFNNLKNSLGDEFGLFAGEVYFNDTIKTDSKIKYVSKVKNFFFLKRKFLLQTGMWKQALTSENLVLELNPRIISNWILLLLRKKRKKKTILWGHAWSRKGRYSKSDVIRNFMRQMGDIIIVYTKSQAQELKEIMPKKDIRYAPNALYFMNDMDVDTNLLNPKNIIYVGRLVPSKKPLILVKAFTSIKNRLSKDTKLIIVGEGPERRQIQRYIEKFKLKNKVILTGHISNYETLKKLYHESLVSVSPGYVGLSITQSLGFGVPMIISKYEPHSPEIEAAIDGFNSLFFETDDIEDLGDKILEVYKNKDKWLKRRKKICNFCKENYSIEKMANTFLELIK